MTSAKAGRGHPLKHRVLDLASGAIQRKYPVEAISTYLNGFHMYADDMGRQVEARAAGPCRPVCRKEANAQRYASRNARRTAPETAA